MDRRRSAGSRPRRARSSQIDIVDAVPLRNESPLLVLCLVEARFPTGHARDLPGAARAAARRRGLGPARDLRGGRLDRLRRARGPGRGPRAAAPRCAPTASRSARTSSSSAGRRGGRRRRRHGRRAPGRRRAVQLLDRLRRRADHEGVPQGRAGREPGARAAALPDRARLPAHRLAGRLVRGRGPPDRRHARDPAGVPGRLPRRLGARAGRARRRPGRPAGPARGARRR